MATKKEKPWLVKTPQIDDLNQSYLLVLDNPDYSQDFVWIKGSGFHCAGAKGPWTCRTKMTRQLAFDWWQFLFYRNHAFCECQFRICPGPPAIICADQPSIIKIKIALSLFSQKTSKVESFSHGSVQLHETRIFFYLGLRTNGPTLCP